MARRVVLSFAAMAFAILAGSLTGCGGGDSQPDPARFTTTADADTGVRVIPSTAPISSGRTRTGAGINSTPPTTTTTTTTTPPVRSSSR